MRVSGQKEGIRLLRGPRRRLNVHRLMSVRQWCSQGQIEIPILHIMNMWSLIYELENW